MEADVSPHVTSGHSPIVKVLRLQSHAFKEEELGVRLPAPLFPMLTILSLSLIAALIRYLRPRHAVGSVAA
jgi:hypothetical protein